MKQTRATARWLASALLASAIAALVASAGSAQDRIGGERTGSQRTGGQRLTPAVNKPTPIDRGGYGQALGHGHNLDGSLQIGSGGYNRSSWGGLDPGILPYERYTVGSTRPLWTLNRNGEFVYNTHNAFNPRSRYRATGYTGNYLSPPSYSRFRSGGQY
jgi:hypothetical protein